MSTATKKSRPTQKTGHPCPWTPAVLDEVVRQLDIEAMDLGTEKLAVIDGFAGGGKRVWEHVGARRHIWIGLELEPSFIEAPWVQQGNALHIPFGARSFDAYATSLVFPNGLADDFVSSEDDDSHRNTYSHYARANRGDRTYRLHQDNAGAMGWGRKGDGSRWRNLHSRAFAEGRRVLGRGGLFVIEIKDHIVKGRVVPVTDWVVEELGRQGCAVMDRIEVPVPGNRFGANGALRVDHSTIVVARVS